MMTPTTLPSSPSSLVLRPLPMIGMSIADVRPIHLRRFTSIDNAIIFGCAESAHNQHVDIQHLCLAVKVHETHSEAPRSISLSTSPRSSSAWLVHLCVKRSRDDASCRWLQLKEHHVGYPRLQIFSPRLTVVVMDDLFMYSPVVFAFPRLASRNTIESTCLRCTYRSGKQVIDTSSFDVSLLLQ